MPPDEDFNINSFIFSDGDDNDIDHIVPDVKSDSDDNQETPGSSEEEDQISKEDQNEESEKQKKKNEAAGGEEDEGGDDQDEDDSEEDDSEEEDHDSDQEEEPIDMRPFAQLIHEKFGWEWNEEMNKIPMDSPEDFVDYIDRIIEANSTPQIEDPRAQEFYEFLESGGNLDQYLSYYNSAKEVSNLDISSSENQKIAVREYLKRTTRFSDEKIRKEISRLESTDELESEATEALDWLKEDDENRQQELINQQKEEEENQQRAISENREKLYNTIQTLNEIAEFPLSNAEKERFSDFLLTPDPETGHTPYQQMYLDNKMLTIELAFLAFKGLKKSKISTSVESDVTKRIKNSLKKFNTTKNSRGQAVSRTKTKKPKNYDQSDYDEFTI